MPKVEKAKGFSYPQTVKYWVNEPDPESGALKPTEKEFTFDVLRMQRTSSEHSKFALLYGGFIEQNADLVDIAVAFVKCAVTNKEKDDLMKDVFACLNLMDRDDVREDIENFLSNVDYVNRVREAMMSLSEPGHQNG